jgi:pyridoxal phosphate-dependent aminotransferase EpsN
VGLASGTAALHLALLLAGVEAGDEVLTSTFTFAASAFAIRYLGASPVFVDSDRGSWNMDPGLLAEEVERLVAAGRPPAAVMPVHLYGQAADLDPILAVSARHGIPVIEDAAEAIGASYRGRAVGTLGRMGAFSFNGNKLITTSGGGALVSEDPALIERARFLSRQAREETPDRHYLHREVGYNYRMSNLLAALGLGQLEVLAARVARRREIREHYRAELAGLPGVEFMPEAAYGQSNGWLTCILVDPAQAGSTREEIQAALEREDIESRPLWMPMHLQPVFAASRCVGGEVSADLYARGLCLPSGSALTGTQVERVARVVQEAVAGRSRRA